MLTRNPFPLSEIETFPTKLQLPEGDASGQYYLAAMLVIIHFFGIEWAERWVMGTRGEKGDFLRNDWSTVDRRETHKLRILQLAEMLINLQDAPHFWSVLETMVGTGVEAGFSELEAGALMKRRGIRFAFRTPTGNRGNDYDLDIDLDGFHVCGETKCKVEKTAVSVKSLLNSVEDARSRNLPPDQPGAVFVKIPQPWFDDASFQAQIDIDLPNYLKSAGRLAMVVVSSSPEIAAGPLTVSLSAWKSVINKDSRFYDRRLEIFDNAPIIDGRWIDLVRVWGPYIPAHNHEEHEALRSSVTKIIEWRQS